jgi:hypothetical protein
VLFPVPFIGFRLYIATNVRLHDRPQHLQAQHQDPSHLIVPYHKSQKPPLVVGTPYPHPLKTHHYPAPGFIDRLA